MVDASEIRAREVKNLQNAYHELKKPLFMLCLSILKDYSLAQDALSEVYVKIIDGAPSEPVRNKKAWLFTLARNTSLDMLRKRSRERCVDFDSDTLDIPADGGNDIDDANNSLDFKRAISQFPERDRSIVTLRIFGGLSHKKIADIVGISPGNVKTRYSRCIKALRKYYEEMQQCL